MEKPESIYAENYRGAGDLAGLRPGQAGWISAADFARYPWGLRAVKAPGTASPAAQAASAGAPVGPPVSAETVRLPEAPRGPRAPK